MKIKFKNGRPVGADVERFAMNLGFESANYSHVNHQLGTNALVRVRVGYLKLRWPTDKSRAEQLANDLCLEFTGRNLNAQVSCMEAKRSIGVVIYRDAFSVKI